MSVNPHFATELDFHVPQGSLRVILDSELVWRDGWRTIRVPAGFDTDLASVPRWLRPLAPPWQQSGRAGVLHDYLYRDGGYAGPVRFVDLERSYCDQIFYAALRADGTSWFRAKVMQRAVNAFGRPHYKPAVA